MWRSHANAATCRSWISQPGLEITSQRLPASALTGDNDAMTADDGGAGQFRGARFTSEDFTGAKFRDCDLRQVKITDSWLIDVSLSGLIGNLTVNDVDVTAYVEGELDKRHTERVRLKAMRTASDYRAMWDTIELQHAPAAGRSGHQCRSFGPRGSGRTEMPAAAGALGIPRSRPASGRGFGGLRSACHLRQVPDG
jgi:hypothetical protein